MSDERKPPESEIPTVRPRGRAQLRVWLVMTDDTIDEVPCVTITPSTYTIITRFGRPERRARFTFHSHAYASREEAIRFVVQRATDRVIAAEKSLNSARSRLRDVELKYKAHR